MTAFALISCQSSKYEVKHRDKPVPPQEFNTVEESIIKFENQWWVTFEDPQLNDFMQTAFTDNLDLAEAWARLRQARAELSLSEVDQIDFRRIWRR